MDGGQFVAQLGELDPGSSVKISLVVTPETAGNDHANGERDSPGKSTRPCERDRHDDRDGSGVSGYCSSSVRLLFTRSLNTAGVADLSVVRTVGSLGPVTVNYQTVAVNATPGLDFVPISGTLTFASGQTVGTILVPVLNDLWENHDDVVNVVLSSPGGGATLGTLTTAQLSIVDTDPDTTPPEVSQLTWSGTSTRRSPA